MKHTQEQIDLLADVYYDGMASVMDRIEEISRVDETNAYIKNRFGSIPSDSELVIEGTLEETIEIPLEAYAVKWVSLFIGILFMIMAVVLLDRIAVCISSVFICTFFIMSHIEKFSGR